MADDTADDRWTIRGIPKAMREAAAGAAQRRKVSVGEWMCEAIDRHLQAEREPFDLVGAPSANAADTADMPADLELERIERTIAAAVALAGANDVPIGFRRAANRLLKASLPQSPGRPRKPPPLRLAGGTEASDAA